MSNEDLIIDQITATVEILGQEMSGQVIAIMADDLQDYTADEVQAALKRVRRECTKLTLAAIFERIPGGWPGPEEAWATFPKSESETGIVTQEAMEAWGVAQELWYSGDKIAARMAFRESYQKKISESELGRPKWRVSLGHDPEMREHVIKAGIEQNLITDDTAKKYLPHLSDDDETTNVKKTDIAMINKLRKAFGSIKPPLDELPNN